MAEKIIVVAKNFKTYQKEIHARGLNPTNAIFISTDSQKSIEKLYGFVNPKYVVCHGTEFIPWDIRDRLKIINARRID